MASPPLALHRLAIAERLREIGSLLRLRPNARFQARAYEGGGDAVDSLSDAALQRHLEEGTLTQVPGIGDAIAREIERLAHDGTSRFLEALREEFPPAIVELTQLRGLRLPKAFLLRDTLGVRSLDDLERACLEEKVRTVKGFGPATEKKLLASIREYRERPESVLLVDAMELADRLVAHVAHVPGVHRVERAGELRRAVETPAVVAIAVAADHPADVLAHAAEFPPFARIESRGDHHVQGRTGTGATMRIAAATPSSFAWTWLQETGSPAHVALVETHLHARGISMVHARDEAEIYEAIGTTFVPPELREGKSELEIGSRPGGFADLVQRSDVLGAVHCHSVFSDGRDTIEDLARGCKALGFRYLTITDHSPTAHYAGGVTVDRLRAQWDEIERVRELVPEVTIFRGTEADILADGAIDYPDDILRELDVVIASIHTRHKLDRAAMTERVLRAMQHPCFKIWGHPLGRLVMHRPPIDCDVERILDALARSRGAIEVNGDPYRLDMEPRWIEAARERGIPFVLSSDAHSVRGMVNVSFAVAMARRGGVRRSEVLNARDAQGFRDAVRPGC